MTQSQKKLTFFADSCHKKNRYRPIMDFSLKLVLLCFSLKVKTSNN